MKTIDIITKELQRQADESRAHGLGWLDMKSLTEAVIDGRVDLVALAAAIDKHRAADK